jgi:Uma2 family endonuclease
MSQAAMPTGRLSIREYFRREAESQIKHDYLDGHAVAMAGGSPTHSLISANVVGAKGNKLRKKPCQVYDSNLLIGTPDLPYTHYPDAAVICGPLEYDPRDLSRMTVINPTVIVEVLSPSTEGIDRGEKFDHYRSLKSFREYVLIRQDRAEIQTFLRQDDGTWRLSVHAGLKTVVKLETVGIAIGMSEIYRGVTFESVKSARNKRKSD